MARLRPGWLVALWSAALGVSAWLPWLTTATGGGGRASAIGGALGSIVLPARFGPGQLIVLLSSVLVVLGAMTARGLSPRLSAVAALLLSVLVVILTWWYYHANVRPPVSAGYGLYLGALFAVAALICSVWAVLAAVLRS